MAKLVAFVDTSIFLSFYKFTKDDLEQLRKIEKLLKHDDLLLLLPQQVRDEFQRRRDEEIADALDVLTKWKIPSSFPALCLPHPEYDELRAQLARCDATHKALVKRVEAAVVRRELAADRLLADLFEGAKSIPWTSRLQVRARRRAELGNPPGKRGTIGDQMNWESLLEAAPLGDLHLISRDGDYVSRLDDTAPKSFLVAEWTSKKSGTLHYYSTLSAFFGKHFPKIRFASELERDVLVAKLIDSSTFAETHATIAALWEYGSDFTPQQRRAIASAALANNQIRWIGHDPDVAAFLERVIRGHEEDIDSSAYADLKAAYRWKDGPS
jgi:hypothetical protein